MGSPGQVSSKFNTQVGSGSTSQSWTPMMLYLVVRYFRCLVILSRFLPALGLTNQVFDHSTMLSRSCVSSATESMILYSTQLSAKSLIAVCGDTLAPMSFSYKGNISGPSTVPWGTPERTRKSQGRLAAVGSTAMTQSNHWLFL